MRKEGERGGEEEESARNEEGKQKDVKCNRRGVKEKEGFRGRDTETWTGFKVPRRSEQLEERCTPGVRCVYVCIYRCICILMYIRIYLPVYTCPLTCPETRVNIIWRGKKKKHLRVKLGGSTY